MQTREKEEGWGRDRKETKQHEHHTCRNEAVKSVPCNPVRPGCRLC